MIKTEMRLENYDNGIKNEIKNFNPLSSYLYLFPVLFL